MLPRKLFMGIFKFSEKSVWDCAKYKVHCMVQEPGLVITHSSRSRAQAVGLRWACEGSPKPGDLWHRCWNLLVLKCNCDKSLWEKVMKCVEAGLLLQQTALPQHCSSVPRARELEGIARADRFMNPSALYWGWSSNHLGSGLQVCRWLGPSSGVLSIEEK